MKYLLALMVSLSMVSGCGYSKHHDKAPTAGEHCDECKEPCDHCDADGDGVCDAGCDCDCGCHTDAACDCDCGCCDEGCCDGCECPDCDCACADGACAVDPTATASRQSVSPFELPNMNDGGALYKSADHPGVYLFESYFLSCPYCNDNAPNVHVMAKQYDMAPLVHVIDLGIDRSDGQYATWISRHNPEHPVLKDASRVVTNQLGTSGYPSAYVVNCNMEIVYKTTGVWEEDVKEEIRSAINNAIATCDSIPVAN